MTIPSHNNPAGSFARGGDKVLKFVSCASLLIMLSVSLADVIARYVVNAPIFGAAEIIAHFLVLTVFSALPIVTASRRHITVDLFELSTSKTLKSLINRLLDLVSAIALFLIAYSVFRLALDYWDLQDASTELSFPKYIVAGGLVILSTVAGLALIVRAIAYPDEISNIPNNSELGE